MEKCGMYFDHYGEYSRFDGSETFRQNFINSILIDFLIDSAGRDYPEKPSYLRFQSTRSYGAFWDIPGFLIPTFQRF